MRYLLLLFISLPILEMWLLIEVGARVGAISTIALVFLTALIGLALLRKEGSKTLLRVNQQIEQGQLPAKEILEGVMLAVAGALLLTPGFITDAIGFACLIPLSRHLIVAAMMRQGLVMAKFGNTASFDQQSPYSGFTKQSFRANTVHSFDAHEVRQAKEDDVIEGDFKRED